MELTAAERLEIFLLLHHPKLKMHTIRLSESPGFLQSVYGLIDIRGASYDSKSHPLRLWQELHHYYSQHIDVLKRKHGQPTLILWNGRVFHLDQTRTFKEVKEERRPRRKRERSKKTLLEGG